MFGGSSCTAAAAAARCRVNPALPSHMLLLTPAMPHAATGKTQLCLAAAVHAAGEGKRVVYVDTSNAVSGRRLEELAAAQQGTPQVC